MKYRTVKEVIDFVGELSPKDTADNQLCIQLEFYDGDDIVCGVLKNMNSEYTTVTLKSGPFLAYLVDGFKIEMRDYCIEFILTIKEPSSI